MSNRSQLIEDCELMRLCLTDFEKLDKDIKAKVEESMVVAELVSNLVKDNASTAQSQEDYLQKYDSLTKRYTDITDKLEKLRKEQALRKAQDKAILVFINTLIKQPLVLDEWDDTIWSVMVEKGIVHKDGSITFVFYNGTEIEIS